MSNEDIFEQRWQARLEKAELWVWLMLIGACAGGVMGSTAYNLQPHMRTAWVTLTLTDDEATSIQVSNIVQAIKMVYANQPAIPSGDITNIAIQIGAFKGFIPDVPFDSVANERVKQSMSRIHVDPNSGRVTDNHARSMHVIGVVNEVKVEFGH